ncbi:hypothetical protein J2D73_13845 [Acetobacter sacchari]|uniref:Flagellar hook-length control protein-like C-terminal domain-containing protein n=1 Tax=Acetobacter sacchari TaxID=2661687 RepID=A0ABS3LY72_9PROT|nr:hypothetical protein [Acetobacter sacchari]MBO1360869.1 hypothetical protein [Acetobacter sacchari]
MTPIVHLTGSKIAPLVSSSEDADISSGASRSISATQARRSFSSVLANETTDGGRTASIRDVNFSRTVSTKDASLPNKPTTAASRVAPGGSSGTATTSGRATVEASMQDGSKSAADGQGAVDATDGDVQARPLEPGEESDDPTTADDQQTLRAMTVEDANQSVVASAPVQVQSGVSTEKGSRARHEDDAAVSSSASVSQDASSGDVSTATMQLFAGAIILAPDVSRSATRIFTKGGETSAGDVVGGVNPGLSSPEAPVMQSAQLATITDDKSQAQDVAPVTSDDVASEAMPGKALKVDEHVVADALPQNAPSMSADMRSSYTQALADMQSQTSPDQGNSGGAQATTLQASGGQADGPATSNGVAKLGVRALAQKLSAAGVGNAVRVSAASVTSPEVAQGTVGVASAAAAQQSGGVSPLPDVTKKANLNGRDVQAANGPDITSTVPTGLSTRPLATAGDRPRGDSSGQNEDRRSLSAGGQGIAMSDAPGATAALQMGFAPVLSEQKLASTIGQAPFPDTGMSHATQANSGEAAQIDVARSADGSSVVTMTLPFDGTDSSVNVAISKGDNAEGLRIHIEAGAADVLQSLQTDRTELTRALESSGVDARSAQVTFGLASNIGGDARQDLPSGQPQGGDSGASRGFDLGFSAFGDGGYGGSSRDSGSRLSGGMPFPGATGRSDDPAESVFAASPYRRSGALNITA